MARGVFQDLQRFVFFVDNSQKQQNHTRTTQAVVQWKQRGGDAEMSVTEAVNTAVIPGIAAGS